MGNALSTSIIGTLIALFSALLWRRLDSIDTTLKLVQADLKQFYGDTKELKGRVDEISHRVP